ncbi:helix-turn-helix domain-containing protein [Microvirga zambiensis]|uniref:helix-turn-helix domain-containing protein n=1 Tax=Microvirga zambiensis TaxID=1402137 RepID=UPI00191DF273|nr:helix-turn-helix domain-containing protein [Microvirga zambiensis]
MGGWTTFLQFLFDRAYTVPEVAEKLAISPRQVQAHIDDGSLPAVNVGRGSDRHDLRILDDDLEAFVRRRKLVPPHAPGQRMRGTPRPTAGPAPDGDSYAAQRAARRLRKGA